MITTSLDPAMVALPSLFRRALQTRSFKLSSLKSSLIIDGGTLRKVVGRESLVVVVRSFEITDAVFAKRPTTSDPTTSSSPQDFFSLMLEVTLVQRCMRSF
jgi:hypothetical protein